MARTLDWYFDVVSGYAYLQFARLAELPDELEIRCHPVLFAGLLKHFGQLGPAEIPSKRIYTYRHWVWRAGQLGIPFKMPPAHPFNPLPVLRLITALGAGRAVVADAFRFIWAEGGDIESAAGWQALCARLGVSDGDHRVQDPAVKQALMETTADAAAKGVFGVPACVVDGYVFWGEDATDMVKDYLADPGALEAGELARVAGLPIGTERKR